VADAAGDLAGDGANLTGDGGLAICNPDPLVIASCRQLEPACENCPPGGAPPRNQAAADCFALVDRARAGLATDADCVKFAADKMCKVDQGGNACGSLNCGAPGCNARACDTAYNNGDSTACRRLLATCPCK
jgi:hypothetical protein